jgi:hypothetical protein
VGYNACAGSLAERCNHALDDVVHSAFTLLGANSIFRAAAVMTSIRKELNAFPNVLNGAIPMGVGGRVV